MDFKFLPEDQKEPEKGNVLLSEPFLDDPYFKRTVVLICEHNEEGSFGFVLNNFIDFDIEEVIDDIPQLESKVSIGGPVKNSSLYYIHTLGEELGDSIKITDGVFMGGDFEKLKEKLKNNEVRPDQVRFFVGYSGWSPNQLAHELKSNSWFVTSVNSDVIMRTDVNDLWGTILKSMGKKFEIIANLPEDPSQN